MMPSDVILQSPVWSTVSLFSALILGTVLLVKRTFFSSKSDVAFLPLPDDAHFVWGHEKQVAMHEPGVCYRAWAQKLGLVYRIKAAFWAPDILVLADPVAVTYLLQKKIYNYHHSAVVRPRIARLMGKGLGWVEGEHEHKRMRRLTMPALTVDNIRANSTTISESALTVVNELVRYVRRQGDVAEVNILDWSGKATLDIVGRVAFLHDFKGGDSEDARKILNARKDGISPNISYMGFLTLMLLRRFTFLNYLPLNALRGQALAKQTIQEGVARQLYSRRAERLHDSQRYDSKDLLTMLLRAAAEERISVEEVYNQISTFIIGGFESTTTTVAFAIWELARYPEKQHRLREELATVAGEPSFKDMQDKLPYLDAILKETLRLYPGLAYMERVATETDTIPLRDPVTNLYGQSVSTIVVHPGQTVIIPIIALQRQNNVWKDPDVFRPERWLEELPSADQLFAGWGNMLAFSDGPRSCIGARLAIFNFKVILATMAARFHFEPVPDLQMSLKIASSLQPWVSRGEDEPGRNALPVILQVLESVEHA